MFFCEPSSMFHSVAMLFSARLTGLRLGLPKNVGQARVLLSSAAAFLSAWAAGFVSSIMAFGLSGSALTALGGAHETITDMTALPAASANRRGRKKSRIGSDSF